MRRFRFHIGGLLILIVLLGVGFAALREANDLWDGIALSLTVVVLAIAVLLAMHRKVERRAFWVAFALFGWGYLGLTALPSIEPRLLTTRALAYLDSQVPGRSVVISGQLWGGPVNNAGQSGTAVALSSQGSVLAGNINSGGIQVWSMVTGKAPWSGGATTENFVRIGHSLFALILAWLGGQLSRRLHVRSREPVPAPETVEAPGVG